METLFLVVPLYAYWGRIVYAVQMDSAISDLLSG